MNERIKAIAEQAGEEVVNEVFEEYMITETSDGATLKVPAIFIARLAELIVQDCMAQCDPEPGLKYSPNALSSRLDCKARIQQLIEDTP